MSLEHGRDARATLLTPEPLEFVSRGVGISALLVEAQIVV
jgi:hypothetical protein